LTSAVGLEYNRIINGGDPTNRRRETMTSQKTYQKTDDFSRYIIAETPNMLVYRGTSEAACAAEIDRVERFSRAIDQEPDEVTIRRVDVLDTIRTAYAAARAAGEPWADAVDAVDAALEKVGVETACQGAYEGYEDDGETIVILDDGTRITTADIA
jgi:hypothetical protein